MKKAWSILLFVVLVLIAGCRAAQPEAESTAPTTQPDSENALAVVSKVATANPTAANGTILEAPSKSETAVSTTLESAPPGTAVSTTPEPIDAMTSVAAISSELPTASPTPIKPTRQPIQPSPQASATRQQQETLRTSETPRSNSTPVVESVETAVATTIATTSPLSRTVPTAPPVTPQGLTTAEPTIVNYDVGSIPAESLVSGVLERDEIHSYSFSVDGSIAISVTAVAMPDANIIVSVYNVDGELIGEQNSTPAGELEHLTSLWLTSPGDYWVEVRIANNVPSQYLLMLLKPDSYAFRHQGMLTIDDTVTGNLTAQTDHFWFFAGNAGETVTITGVPGNGGDLFLELYNADAENTLGFIDEGIAGNSEVISGYVLPTTGVYSIRVGEYDFREVSYQLTITSSVR